MKNITSNFKFHHLFAIALLLSLPVMVLLSKQQQVFNSHAAGSSVAVEAENGTVSAGAKIITDTAASGQRAIQFAPDIISPTGTPNPSGSPTTNFCGSFPALPNTKPEASNTGVPAGTALTASGSINASTDGMVIEGKDVTGTITVTANNVTIKNSKVHPAGGGSPKGIIVSRGTGTKIINSEVYTTGGGYIGIDAGNTTVCGSYLHGWENAMTVGGGMTIQANFIEKLQGTNSGAHHDGIEVYYGGNSKIWGNNIRMTDQNGAWLGETNALNIGAYTAIIIDSVEVNGNWLGGGSYSLGVREKNGAKNTNIVVTNNRWYRNSYQFGTHDVQPQSAVSAWSGNVFDDNGQVIGK